MNKIEELESRVEELECEMKEVRKLLSLDTFGKLSIPAFDPKSIGGPGSYDSEKKGFGTQIVLRKPIMYLYNFTGDTLNCNIDFKTNVIADSVPEIRKDNKIVFSLDSDSFINEKYGYLYYEFDITGNEPKSSSYTFVKNNKNLDYELRRLALCLGFNQEETIDFVAYWSLELKRMDTEFFKCEIFDESKLEKLFPIEISPSPSFLARRYVKFVPIDKIGKGNITADQFRPKARTGSLRVFEWGGWISGSGVVK